MSAQTTENTLVSVRVAADLTRTTEAHILSLVLSGVVRSAQIKGELYVALSDVERSTNEGRRP
jgi:hypothetical protein